MSVTNVRVMGQRARVGAIPYNGLQGRLETDFHVQWVGTLEVDDDLGVSDDEVVEQGEGVFVDRVGSIFLWHKKTRPHRFLWTCV